MMNRPQYTTMADERAFWAQATRRAGSRCAYFFYARHRIKCRCIAYQWVDCLRRRRLGGECRL